MKLSFSDIFFDCKTRQPVNFAGNNTTKFSHTFMDVVNLEKSKPGEPDYGGGHHYVFSMVDSPLPISDILKVLSDSKIHIDFQPIKQTSFDVIQKVTIFSSHKNKAHPGTEKIIVKTTPNKHTLFFQAGMAEIAGKRVYFGIHWKAFPAFFDLQRHQTYADKVKTQKLSNIVQVYESLIIEDWFCKQRDE